MLYNKKIASKYDSFYSGKEYKIENIQVANLLLDYLGGRILDLGCGTGLFLELFDYWDYIGTDISGDMPNQARKKYPDRIFIETRINKISDVS